MTDDFILESTPADGIRLLTFNRPKALNALNKATVQALDAALDRAASDDSLRVLLLTGSGEKAFVAGADIKEMQAYTPLQAQGWARHAMTVLRKLETLPIPTVAVVNGYALGGGNELAMSCDFIVASDNAKFGQPEVNLGVTAGFGGTQRLTRLVGRGRALELLYTGRMIDAQEALRIGLAAQVFPLADLMSEAVKIATTIASKGPAAVRLTKQAVQRGQDMDLDNACQFEAQVFGLCFSTEDQKEGMAAFSEKRGAVFRNS